MLYSGAGGKLIHQKNQKQKISWHRPFKVYKALFNNVFEAFNLLKKCVAEFQLPGNGIQLLLLSGVSRRADFYKRTEKAEF